MHAGVSYTGYSIWVSNSHVSRSYQTLICPQDTFRAEWTWQILLGPERINGMVQSMLQDYVEVSLFLSKLRLLHMLTGVRQGGWLPMWKNIVGTQ